MTWVLIIMMFNGGISQAPMPDLETCEKAARSVEWALSNGGMRNGAVACVSRARAGL